MVEIRPSRPDEVQIQKELWQAAFGDDPRYIDWFYQCCWRPEDMLLLLEDGKLASMLALLPQTVTLPGGGTAAAWYIYALATDPAARSKGYGRQLLLYADEFLRQRGADCVTVVPAEASLFKFFSMVGFLPGFFTRKVELLRSMTTPSRPEDKVEPIGPEEYNEIRRNALEGIPSVLYGEELIRYQEGMGKLSGGGLYRIMVGDFRGCAAAEYLNEESVLFKELLLPPEHMPRGLAALAAKMPGQRCFVRTPAQWDGMQGSYLQPFGMVKWYNREKGALWGEETQGYMGLGFD
ncbi:GNAT family N-acetyltransferase [uncultured Flavonifractor sp.]|uniref:GNAT family N-acetyltransferase n=1 Tax=uncultured Flavonifractor sp. TaxID=1193534 RepID=UPI002608C08F|nr:GNAT family N-acetyltransferase [uncultured Flavonifractor sp.]